MKRYLAVIFALLFAKSLTAHATPKTFATLDWTVAETLIALQTPPKAMGDVVSYQTWVAYPPLPENIVDLGVRLQPNPEQLWSLSAQPNSRLSLINSSFYHQTQAQLAKFGELHWVDFYQAGDVWQNMQNATRQIGQLAGKPDNAERLLAEFSQKIHNIRPLVQPFTDRPVALVQFVDTRHLRIYTRQSLFGAVLAQLGFDNAWAGSASNPWGTEAISVTQLANLPENTRFVVVKPYPSNIKNALQYNTLWQHLAMAKDPLILPAVWTFGAVPSASRFVDLFAHALQHGGEQW